MTEVEGAGLDSTQLKILRLLVAGESRTTIAALVFYSPQGLEYQINLIKRCLGVLSRGPKGTFELIFVAAERRIVEVPEKRPIEKLEGTLSQLARFLLLGYGVEGAARAMTVSNKSMQGYMSQLLELYGASNKQALFVYWGAYGPPELGDALTPREKEILGLFGQDIGLSEMAMKLRVRPEIVLGALRSAQEFLKVDTPKAALEKAVLLGWIAAPQRQVQVANEALGDALTPREKEILGLFGRNVKLHDIEDELHVSRQVVRDALRRAQELLGVEGEYEAFEEARSLGLIETGGLITRPMQPRWAQVADLVLQGLANRAIAERLGVSLGSVATYMNCLMRHVNVPLGDRAALTTVLQENGWSATGRGNGAPQRALRNNVRVTARPEEGEDL